MCRKTHLTAVRTRQTDGQRERDRDGKGGDRDGGEGSADILSGTRSLISNFKIDESLPSILLLP